MKRRINTPLVLLLLVTATAAVWWWPFGGSWILPTTKRVGGTPSGG